MTALDFHYVRPDHHARNQTHDSARVVFMDVSIQRFDSSRDRLELDLRRLDVLPVASC